MSSSTLLAPASPSRLRHLLGGVVTLGMTATLALVSAPTAAADTAVAPHDGGFTIKGAGWGHGHGMSQYGAYGAATKGKRYDQILSFYYPGTHLDPTPAGTKLRVLVSADDDGSLRVKPAAGLTVRDTSGHSATLPTGSAYVSWRISRSGSGYRLSYRTKAGTYKTRSTNLTSSTWSFSSSSKVLRLILPGARVKPYRGSMALVKRGSSGRTVNTVALEDYVRSVVPAEMPTSWAIAAVQAQAVAARSYAVRLRDFGSYAGYDICDTTSCQVYGGQATESARGDAAVKATARKIVTYGGKVALTQFASSNGGATAASNLPYLTARTDPYDGVVQSQAWSLRVSAASVQRQWPSVGTVRKLQVTARDGSGRWGGRVTTIKVIGSSGTVSVAGSTFQSRFGMKSTLFDVG